MQKNVEKKGKHCYDRKQIRVEKSHIWCFFCRYSEYELTFEMSKNYYKKGVSCFMQLEECYAAFGGSYADVKSRLMKDDLIKRLVIKFLADTSYERLAAAMEQKNYEEAFRAVHTLKGVSQNLSFDSLSRATEGLTETLRKWETIPVDEALCEAQWQQVSADYQTIVDAIRQLQESDI